MLYQYLNIFIAFQVMCLVFATSFTISNTFTFKNTEWFPIYCFYLTALGTHTLRRIMVLVQGIPAATTSDAMVWQTIIAVSFLICSAMTYGLLNPKK